MKQYKINNGIITLELIPNYEIDNKQVVALVRNKKSNNYNETLITYYNESSDFQGLSYVKTYNDNTKIIFNIRNDKTISYEYQYIAYDEDCYTISGNYEDNGKSQSVIIKKDKEERLFRKLIDEDNAINFIYSDNAEKNSNSYQLIINYNEKDNETIYSLYGASYYFEYSEVKEDDCTIENFYNDANLILMYDGNAVYKGIYNNKEIDPDKELEIIINGEELLDEEETEYEEVELDSKYYKNNGHGPIYNKEVSKYIDNIEFYINGLINSFPKINKTIFSKDKEYLESVKDIYPDINHNKLIPNINTNNFITSALHNIRIKSRKR